MPNAGRSAIKGIGHREPTLLRFAWQVVAVGGCNPPAAARLIPKRGESVFSARYLNVGCNRVAVQRLLPFAMLLTT